MSAKDSILDKVLNEANGTSTIKRNRSDKRHAYANRSALSIAKSRNDPLFKKYSRYRALFLAAKEGIIMKYGSRGKQYARKRM